MTMYRISSNSSIESNLYEMMYQNVQQSIIALAYEVNLDFVTFFNLDKFCFYLVLIEEKPKHICRTDSV